jgi:hypothetical protein
MLAISKIQTGISKMLAISKIQTGISKMIAISKASLPPSPHCSGTRHRFTNQPGCVTRRSAR